MAAPGITILKHNVPWGPFTRAQVEDALARGDFTVKYLAHAPGLNEWLPLGEVLDYVARNENVSAPVLPPVPSVRDLPPIPVDVKPPPVASDFLRPAAIHPPPMLPKPQPVPLPIESDPEVPEINLPTGSFFRRFIAFLIDFAILFIPVGLLYIIGALTIEIPGAWTHISHQARMEEWAHLEQNVRELAVLVAVGFGWLYGAGLESSAKQATIGKRWLGLKVTDLRGERVTFLRASGRYAAKYLSALPCFLGFIMALFSSRGRTLHDRMADTRVVRS